MAKASSKKYFSKKPMGLAGLTLVESVVALAILLIVNVSLLSLFVMLKQTGISMRHRLQTINQLSGKLEGLKNSDYSSIVNIVALSVTVDNNSTPLDNTDDITGTYSQTVTETQDAMGINKYKVIEAEILWEERTYLGTRSLSETLTTIINN